MSDLATRLREHVDTAAPPIDVEALVEQLKQEPEVSPAPPIRKLLPRWAYAIAAAAVALILIGGAALLFSGSEPADDPADTPLPPTTIVATIPETSAAVFDFATDDFCEWFAADDINRIVADAQQRAGTNFEFFPFETEPSDCWSRHPDVPTAGWTLSGRQTDSPAAHWATTVLHHFPSPLPDYDEDNHDPEIGPLHGHVLLDEAVRYAWAPGGNGREFRVLIRVAGHDDETLMFTFRMAGQGNVLTPEQEALGFALANETLHHMNWFPGSGTVTVALQNLTGFEERQVLAAVINMDLDDTRRRWNVDPVLLPFVGSFSWSSIDNDPFDGEAVIRDARPFEWFLGSDRALLSRAALLSPGNYTVMFVAPSQPGPINNWADDVMPFGYYTCFAELEVASGEDTRLTITGIPPINASNVPSMVDPNDGVGTITSFELCPQS